MRELLQQDHEESERHEGAERDELLPPRQVRAADGHEADEAQRHDVEDRGGAQRAPSSSNTPNAANAANARRISGTPAEAMEQLP